MPDNRRRHRSAPIAVVATVVWLAALAAGPSATFAVGSGAVAPARIAVADVPPGEDCADPDTIRPGGGLVVCPKAFDLASLLPFVAGGGVVILAILVAWYLVLRRRASRPFAPHDPVDAGEWWACSTCGSTNVVGTARCYKCGSWRR